MDLGYGDAYIPCESPPESLTVKETLTIFQLILLVDVSQPVNS